MKRFISILLVLCLLLSIAGCSSPAEPDTSQTPESAPADTPATPDTPAPEPAEEAKGIVAIVTNTLSQNEEEYRSAELMVEKYPGRVIHELWPDNFMAEQEQMITIVAKIASNPDIKGLVLNHGVPGSNAAVDKLLETRDDMFIVYCAAQENPPDVAARASLILETDKLRMGVRMADQAKLMGAKTLVHYSFPRHMSQVLLSSRRDNMKERCKEIGLEFVDATAPDPTGDSGVTGAQQYILEDVPKMIAKYGKDTALFATNCSMQIPLIKATLDEGGIYPQPCCPSPYHGFPAALGLESAGYSRENMQDVIDETTRIITEKGGAGRFSTYPVPVFMMFTVTGAEYAMKWMDGEVDKDEIDVEVLEKIMSDYAGLKVDSSNYTEEIDGKTVEYPTFKLIIMDYLTYGEIKN